MGRYAVGEPHVTPNHRAFPDGDIAQDGGVGVHGDIVFQMRVAGNVAREAAFVVHKVFGAQRNALIQSAIVPNHRGGTNDNAGAVVNGEPGANLGGRMNVDPRLRVRQLRYHARNKRHPQAIQ